MRIYAITIHICMYTATPSLTQRQLGRTMQTVLCSGGCQGGSLSSKIVHVTNPQSKLSSCSTSSSAFSRTRISKGICETEPPPTDANAKASSVLMVMPATCRNLYLHDRATATSSMSVKYMHVAARTKKQAAVGISSGYVACNTPVRPQRSQVRVLRYTHADRCSSARGFDDALCFVFCCFVEDQVKQPTPCPSQPLCNHLEGGSLPGAGACVCTAVNSTPISVDSQHARHSVL